MLIWQTVAVTLLHEGTGLCLVCPNVTPGCDRLLGMATGCVSVLLERADAEADSELVTVPQWALVCGRYVCVHVCTDICMRVHMSVV